MLAPTVLMKCDGGMNLSVGFAASSPWQGEPLGALLPFPAKTQHFHLIHPVCALGTFPSRGRLEIGVLPSGEALGRERQKDSRPVGGYPYFMFR